MKKNLSMLLATIAMFVAGIATTGCWLALIDEPEMPKSMLNK